MLLAVLVAVGLLGGFWVYVIPTLQGYVPASVSGSKWGQVAVAGTMILLSVWVVGMVVKSTRKVV